MTPEAAEHVLRGLIVECKHVAFDAGCSQGVAYLRVLGEESGREAVIRTPGDRWFSLDVENGLSLEYFEEEVPDGEVEERLSSYFGAALTYVTGGGEVEVGRAGVRLIRVWSSGQEFVLRRSVGKAFFSMFRRRRKRFEA